MRTADPDASAVSPEIVDEWVAAARAAWPEIERDERGFVEELARRLGSGADADAARAIHAADVWLALACADGDPAALAAFDRVHVQRLGPVLQRLGLDPGQQEDVKQELRRKLLVADGERPRIAAFSGRSDLRTWVRTTAVRSAIDLLRRRREVSVDDEDELVALPAAIDDPELAYLKGHYRDQLRAAVAEAIAGLPPRERLVLKSCYVERLGVERLGALLGVHHATAARWLSAARDLLAARTHELLVARLGVTRAELASIARLVESQLDVSIRRLLS